MIPYGRQDINQADIEAVIEVLRSDFLTQGPVTPRFERGVSRYVGSVHAIAVNSATSALHLACIALDLGPGDHLWTTPNTFVASANCAHYCGAQVDFVDIDPNTYNMSAEQLLEKLKIAEKNGTLPKVVVPVHFAGQPCDMFAIHSLARKYGFRIIEDASHALGATYGHTDAKDNQEKQNKSLITKVGSCRHSDFTVFSFHPVKMITSGEGGIATTNDDYLAEHMACLRSHGITTDPKKMSVRPASEIWNYQQVELGFNYRLTDLHAALGLSQLDRLDEFVNARRIISRQYDESLSRLPLQLPWQYPSNRSSYHLYPIRIGQQALPITQRDAYKALRTSGIGVNLHYIPVYRQPYYKTMFPKNYCPEAEKLYKETISIPIFPSLTKKSITEVVAAIKGLFETTQSNSN